jgi:hypothetical protein
MSEYLELKEAYNAGWEAANKVARDTIKKFICYEYSKNGNCPHAACEQLTDAYFEIVKQ